MFLFGPDFLLRVCLGFLLVRSVSEPLLSLRHGHADGRGVLQSVWERRPALLAAASSVSRGAVQVSDTRPSVRFCKQLLVWSSPRPSQGGLLDQRPWARSCPCRTLQWETRAWSGDPSVGRCLQHPGVPAGENQERQIGPEHKVHVCP